MLIDNPNQSTCPMILGQCQCKKVVISWISFKSNDSGIHFWGLNIIKSHIFSNYPTSLNLIYTLVQNVKKKLHLIKFVQLYKKFTPWPSPPSPPPLSPPSQPLCSTLSLSLSFLSHPPPLSLNRCVHPCFTSQQLLSKELIYFLSLIFDPSIK